MPSVIQQLLAGYGATGGGGGGYTPPPGTGWIGLWDASVAASLTLSGSTITNVADQSGSGNHLGDGTTPNRPTYNATGFNSLPTMNFAAGQAIQSTSTFPMGTGNTLTFFMVGTMASGSDSNGRAISYFDGSASDFSVAGSWILARSGGAQTAMLMRATVSVTKAIVYDAPTIIIGTVNSSGVLTIYVDGVASSTNTSSGNWISNGTLGIGGSVSDNVKWNGKYSDLGISTAFNDATAVAALDSFLRTKWGL